MSACQASPASRSLIYGLELLQLFDSEHPVRGISELAELLGVSRPTAHRYAATCLELGYLEQAPMRRYRLARRSAHVGLTLVHSLAISRCARPVLRELRDETGHTTSLAVLDGQEVLYLLRLRGFARGCYELERGIGAGSRRPAAQTAAGNALLAAGGGTGEIHAFQERTAGGLALAVEVERRTGAIEITVPAQSMTDTEAVAILAGRLQAAADRLAGPPEERGEQAPG